MSLQLNRLISGGHYGVSSTAAISRARTAVAPRHQLLVQLAFLLFLALLVEGVARKWIFPRQHEYFYFLRDPLLLGFYLVALTRGALRPKGWFALWLGAACFISLMSLVVYLLYDLPPTLWILGVRNYFMYMPLAFIVARTFQREDIERFTKLVALLAVPMAFVCVMQFFLPPGSWLNVGAGGAPPSMFVDNLMRTTGVLASDAQHAIYIAFTLSLLAARFVGASSSRKERYLLIAGGAATFTMMIVSGSRAVWFQAAGVGLVAVSAFFLTRASIRERLRGIMVALGAGLLVTALFATLFAGAYKGYEHRNLSARTFSGTTTERIAGLFLPKSMFEASIGGEGIGLGTTGAAAVLSGKRALTMGENDLDRNFIELGLFAGWIFVALRVTFALWLVSISVRAARKGDMRALLIASFAALAIFQMQITMHTVYAHLAWFAVGLTMAAARFVAPYDRPHPMTDKWQRF